MNTNQKLQQKLSELLNNRRQACGWLNTAYNNNPEPNDETIVNLRQKIREIEEAIEQTSDDLERLSI